MAALCNNLLITFMFLISRGRPSQRRPVKEDMEAVTVAKAFFFYQRGKSKLSWTNHLVVCMFHPFFWKSRQ
jgi:hypothetical protein